MYIYHHQSLQATAVGARIVGDARADRLAICARFHLFFKWFVAFSADPSTHRRALGRQIINARTTLSIDRKIRFLEASDGASIHRSQPGNVRFLEASDGASIHPCQPGNVRFLEASDAASIHRCQPGNVRFLEASDGASMHRCSLRNLCALLAAAVYLGGLPYFRRLILCRFSLSWRAVRRGVLCSAVILEEAILTEQGSRRKRVVFSSTSKTCRAGARV